jgi:hypothetical protein
MKNVVFWDVALCRLSINRRFGERIASIFRVEKSASGEPAWIFPQAGQILRRL